MNARAMFLLALLALPFATDSLAQCTYGTPTPGQIYSMPTIGMVTQIYGSRMQSSWLVTAVSGVPGEDWDVALYQNSAATSPCVANQLATSTYGGGLVDFVIGDGATNPHTDVYARHNRYSGSGVGRAQWRNAAGVLAVNGFDTNRTWGVDSLVDVWSVTLTAGVTYTLNFSPSAGLGASLHVFRNPAAGTYWAPRSGALATLSATGTFTAPATGAYALVVANDGHAAGTYALGVGDCTPVALANGVIRSAPGKQAMSQFDQSARYWTVISSEHGAVEVYSALGGAYPTCGSRLLASWTSSNSAPSFVVGNFNSITPGRFYARTVTPTGFSSTEVLWDSGAEQLVVDGPPVRRTFDGSNRRFAEVWDLYLVAGQTYRFYQDSQGGGYVVHVFADPGTGNHWFDGDGDVASGMSSFYYTATVTGFHGVVVIASSYYSSGRYTLGVSKAPCAIPVTLEPRVPTTITSPDGWMRFYPYTSSWAAVAVRGGNATDDWDVGISADPSGQAAPQCIGTPLATSALGAGTVDVTALTMENTIWDWHFANFHHVSATSTSATAEYDTTHATLSINAPQSVVSMSATTLVHVYDAYLLAGVAYSIEFIPGASGQSVLVFENPGSSRFAAGRAGALASGTSTVHFTATRTGYHGIVVVNDAGVASSYRIRLGYCSPASGLANNVGRTPTNSYELYSFTPGYQRWGAVGVRSVTTDWDLSVSASLAGTFPNCLGSVLSGSSSSALHYVDLVVGDFHHMVANTNYARALQYSTGAAGAAQVEWSYATFSMVPNTRYEDLVTTGASTPVHTFDTHLEAGTSYEIGFAHSGSADLHLLLFRNPGSGAYWAGRSSAVLDVTTAVGSVMYTPPVSDDYAIIVVNDDGADDTFIPFVRYCPPIVPLTSGLPITVSPTAFVSFTPTPGWWTAVGVRSTSDWDIEVDRVGSGGVPGTCFSDVLALCDATNMVDFVVGDFNGANPPGTYYARPYAYHALSGPGTVEFHASALTLPPHSDPVTRTTNSDDVLTVYDVMMAAGVDYNVYFTHTGSADVKALLFVNPGGVYWAPRSARVLETSGHAIYHSTVSGFHGLVVVNDNGLPGTYTVGLQTAGVAVEGEAPPIRTSLDAVSPNPARGALSVSFALHAPAVIKLELLDLSGRRVATIEEGAREAGRWNAAWSGAGSGTGAVPPGLYYLRLQAGGRTVGERKVVIVR